jgi:hypothetical protein
VWKAGEREKQSAVRRRTKINVKEQEENEEAETDGNIRKHEWEEN